MAQGAKINLRDNDKWTVLHWAAISGSIQTVAFLLESGADVLAKDLHDNSSLHYAIREGHHEISELLKNAENLKGRKGSNGGNALMAMFG
jgi:ankyrin repeat protein